MRSKCLRNLCRLCCGVSLLLGVSACAKSQQLMVLKGLSDESARIEVLLSQQGKDYQRLLKTMESPAWASYKRAKQFEDDFGTPIYKRAVPHSHPALTVWLYRYPTQFLQGPKVYLYFDVQGQLKRFHYVKENE